MSSSPIPDERYREGRALLPNWNEQGGEADARYQRGVALITEAAEAGHLAAINDLADGIACEASFDWSVKLAALGDVGPLISNITSGDYPVEQSREVFAAARSGMPWTQLAVGRLYRMGMRDGDSVLVATRDDAFDCLPGAVDPQAEGLAWLMRAHKVLVELLDETGAPFAERLALYTRLAGGGDAGAHAWLGDRCRLGEGCAVDLVAARAHYERRADAGSGDAMRVLAKMCEQGHAGPVDADRACKLYKSAAELSSDEFSRDRLATRFDLKWYARES